MIINCKNAFFSKFVHVFSHWLFWGGAALRQSTHLASLCANTKYSHAAVYEYLNHVHSQTNPDAKPFNIT